MDLAAHAADLLDRNAYLTLGTASADGRPWTTPVYFAADGLTDFYWVSQTSRRHSVNLAGNPAASLVVFDSTVPPYTGRAVYAEGEAAIVPDDDLDRALPLYPGTPDRGASAITRGDVSGDSPYRLYRARASTVWVLCPRDPRTPCTRHGRDEDHRVQVWPAAVPGDHG